MVLDPERGEIMPNTSDFTPAQRSLESRYDKTDNAQADEARAKEKQAIAEKEDSDTA